MITPPIPMKPPLLAALLLPIALSAGAEPHSDPAFGAVSIPLTLADTTQIREPADLNGQAPDLHINSASQHSFGDIISVRGITNLAFSGAPSAALWIDGMPAGDASSAFLPFYDIHNIDLYRVPLAGDGGFTGAGGLIDFQTERAGNAWHGTISASYASFNSQDYRLSLSGPLIKDKLTLTLSGLQSLSDGYLYNPTLQRRVDNRNTLAGRGTLTWTPLPDWKISAGFDYARAHDGADRLVSLQGNPLEVASDVPGSFSMREHREWLEITKRFDTWQITSLTSHRNWRVDPSVQDLDLSPARASFSGRFPFGAVEPAAAESEIRRRQSTWSEELRIESLPEDTKAGVPFRWCAGFYFEDKRTEGSELEQYTSETDGYRFDAIPVLVPNPILPFRIIIAGPIRLFDPGFHIEVILVPFPITDYTPVTQESTYSLHERTYSGYSIASYTWGPLDVAAGLRLNLIQNSFSETEDNGLGNRFDFGGTDNEFTATPSLGAALHLNRNTDLFASSTYLYKPGGFSPSLNSPESLDHYGQESIWATQIGLTAHTPDNRLRGAIVGYYDWIHHYQVQPDFSLTDSFAINADSAISLGVEGELFWTICRGLTFSGNIGFNQTTLHGYHDPLTGENLSGNRAPYIPEFTARTALDYAAPCGFRARVEYVAFGQTDYTDSNERQYRERPYGLLNARTGFDRGAYGIYLFARNLSDTRYYTMIDAGLKAGVIGEPRVLGVMATLRF